ncbi:MAG: hypothetical protein AAF480_19100, partial [Actinomycetota bacterium]
MTENTTNSNELRQFAADNAGRRKIDVEATLDLHRRAANQIDALSEHVNDLRQRVASGDIAPAAAPVAPTVGEEPSQSALLILRNAQETADQTIAEANHVLADAERTRREADAMAQAKADTAVAKARVEGASIIEAAEVRANEIAAASIVAAERATDAQRAYHSKASSLRADAEGVLALARSMETVAGEDLPEALTAEPFTEPIQRDEIAAAPAPAPVPAPVPEPTPVPEAAAPAPAPVEDVTPAPEVAAPAPEVAAPAPVEDAAPAPAQADLPPPPAPEVAVATELPPPPAAEVLPPPPAAEVLPPPPAPVATDAELIDLTEA